MVWIKSSWPRAQKMWLVCESTGPGNNLSKFWVDADSFFRTFITIFKISSLQLSSFSSELLTVGSIQWKLRATKGKPKSGLDPNSCQTTGCQGHLWLHQEFWHHFPLLSIVPAPAIFIRSPFSFPVILNLCINAFECIGIEHLSCIRHCAGLCTKNNEQNRWKFPP